MEHAKGVLTRAPERAQLAFYTGLTSIIRHPSKMLLAAAGVKNGSIPPVTRAIRLMVPVGAMQVTVALSIAA